ncbi:MAG TPA: hypothetical protein VIP98_24385 [Microlunatus sp.]
MGGPDTSDALRRAAVKAAMAPSIFNTQPWRLLLTPDELRVHADRSRQLPLLDPSGRQLMISLGCAVTNARIRLAADGIGVTVRRISDSAGLNHGVAIVPSGAVDVDQAGLAELAGVLDEVDGSAAVPMDAIPDELPRLLAEAATAESATLINASAGQQTELLESTSAARSAIEVDGARSAELLAWLPENVALWADPTPVLARFDDQSPPLSTVLICTAGDQESDWLRSGECLQRMLLLIQRHGLTAMPDTLLTDNPRTRRDLQSNGFYPQVVLFIGAAGASPTARRRRLSDVITEQA